MMMTSFRMPLTQHTTCTMGNTHVGAHSWAPKAPIVYCFHLGQFQLAAVGRVDPGEGGDPSNVSPLSPCLGCSVVAQGVRAPKPYAPAAAALSATEQPPLF